VVIEQDADRQQHRVQQAVATGLARFAGEVERWAIQIVGLEHGGLWQALKKALV